MRVVFGGLAMCPADDRRLLLVHGAVGVAIMAAVVMAILGFFFAAVSGNLVGLIGSSNNPISGLTLSTCLSRR